MKTDHDVKLPAADGSLDPVVRRCPRCVHVGSVIGDYIRCDHPSWAAIKEPVDSEARQMHATFAEECVDFEIRPLGLDTASRQTLSPNAEVSDRGQAASDLRETHNGGSLH